ncbi:MAG: FtsX-like permease family protein [bacterium]|nr:FtsX-like permease family protein [bacterium]
MKKIPAAGEWLLKRLLLRDEYWEKIGDYEEDYLRRRNQQGDFTALLWFWLQVLLAVPVFLKNKIYWSAVMYKNYLKVTIRNILKQKVFSFINISGLAVGLACSILILLWVNDELSYEDFHINADRIFRVTTFINMGGNELDLPKTGPGVTKKLVATFPEVEDAVIINPIPRSSVKYLNTQFFEDNIFFADKSFFNIFSYELIRGDPGSVLELPYTAVITREYAEKYFQDEDPVGKILNFNNVENYTITGIVDDLPSNSHIDFDILCSFETVYSKGRRASIDRFLNPNFYGYILLAEGFDFVELENKMPEMIPDQIKRMGKARNLQFIMSLQPITKIHLHSKLAQDFSDNSNIVYIYIFTAVSVFIILIACFNFINLSTARSSLRAREIGMRKVSGACKNNLVFQFLGESLVYSFISLLLAVILVNLALPVFNSITEKELSLFSSGISLFFLELIGLTLLIGFMSGSYPALFLSRFNPVNVLKGNSPAGSSRSGLRSVLVVCQFSISIVLIIGTVLVFNQLKFIKDKELGFDKEQILVLPTGNNSFQMSLPSLKSILYESPGIDKISAVSRIPGRTIYKNPYVPEGFAQGEFIWMGEMDIDQDFLETMDIELIEGRNFSTDMQTDLQNSVIINETAVKQAGWTKPIGKYITTLNKTRWQVIGVVKDFHTSSLHSEIEPLRILFSIDSHIDYLTIKIRPGYLTHTLDFLQNKWSEIDQNKPLDYFFLDDTMDSLYRADQRFGRIFNYFTILAIIIACMGLFGMASFTAERRIKEIGIRKVLGASSYGLVYLLSRDFLKMIIISNIISWPIALYFAQNWLRNFAYRTDLDVSIFLIAGFLSILTALLTVSYQTVKTSLANPVDSLRYE